LGARIVARSNYREALIPFEEQEKQADEEKRMSPAS
jgi:hypothetical protein